MKYIIYALSILLFFNACKKSKKEQPKVELKEPQKSVLLSPQKDEACLATVVLSVTKSKITFNWKSAENADSYELVIKNLLNDELIRKTTTTKSLEAELTRNTPYSWHVVSKSASTEKENQSDTWRFYNPGEGVSYYAPFPAEIISPVIGETTTALNNKTTLKWKGSDADNDIVSYDLYFGTSANPPFLKGDLSGVEVTDVSVVSNTTYYWKIITKDSKGNSSDSGVFYFKVN